MSFLVLNQYRKGSGYKDKTGELYHFPLKYQKPFSNLPAQFVYYEPREGGEQVYFGSGTVTSVYEDTEDVGHAYAEISGYEAFLCRGLLQGTQRYHLGASKNDA